MSSSLSPSSPASSSLSGSVTLSDESLEASSSSRSVSMSEQVSPRRSPHCSCLPRSAGASSVGPGCRWRRFCRTCRSCLPTSTRAASPGARCGRQTDVLERRGGNEGDLAPRRRRGESMFSECVYLKCMERFIKNSLDAVGPPQRQEVGKSTEEGFSLLMTNKFTSSIGTVSPSKTPSASVKTCTVAPSVAEFPVTFHN